MRHVRTPVLDVAYADEGPPDGDVVVLLHGWPYDVHSYDDVVPRLTAAGRRVLVPYLRGHGPTRFLDPATPRSGQQAALGRDVVDLLDALDVPAATLDGEADGNFPATDGSAQAGHFTGPRLHRTVPAAGHNLPAEAPEAFARAVLDAADLAPRPTG